MSTCPSCSSIVDSAQPCPHCGKALPAQEASPAPVAATEEWKQAVAQVPIAPPPAMPRYRSLEHFAWGNPGALTLGLVGACVAVALLTLVGDEVLLHERLFAFGAKVNEEVAGGAWWRLVSSTFLHGSWTHLLFNAYALFVVGSFIEKAYGRERLFSFFVLAAIGGSLASYLFVPAMSVGASGAIFGLMGAGLLAYWRSDQALVAALGPKQLLLLGFWAIQNLVDGFMPNSGVDNAAHVGGLASGLAAAASLPAGAVARACAVAASVAVLTAGAFTADYAPRALAFQRGLAAQQRGDPDEAEREYLRAGRFSIALLNRAVLRAQRQDFAGALELGDATIAAGARDEMLARAHLVRVEGLAQKGWLFAALAAAGEAAKSHDEEIRRLAENLRNEVHKRILEKQLLDGLKHPRLRPENRRPEHR